MPTAKKDTQQIMGGLSRDALLALAVVFMTLVAILGWGFGIFQARRAQAAPTVPHSVQFSVKELPDNLPGELLLESDLSIFDLRFWKPVPEDKRWQPVSPVNYTNYLRITKTKPVKYFYAHYATSGTGIDFQCPSNPFRVLKAEAKNLHVAEGERSYAVEIDISHEPVGETFLVLLQATYWNGFRDENSGDAATYTGGDPVVPKELGLLILFPNSKKCRDLRLETGPNSHPDWTEYGNQREATVSSDGTSVYWNIHNKKPDHHYKMVWHW